MSHRELWVLIDQLPQESRTQTALRDKQENALLEPSGEQKFGPWTPSDFLMANLIDAVNFNTYVTARAAGDKDFPKPTPTARPGMNRPIRRQSQAAIAYLKKLRGKG